jgi:hypothetical protein
VKTLIDDRAAIGPAIAPASRGGILLGSACGSMR